MARAKTGGIHIPAVVDVLTPASDLVVLDGVHASLLTFAAQLAYLHFLLFGIPLCVTSGIEDGYQCGNFHEDGRALDFLTSDKADEENRVFWSILEWAVVRQNSHASRILTADGGTRIHLEYHGA